jgi:MSHA biogenesis protein MshL
VKLNDQYQLGVDWSLIANGAGWSVEQALIGTNLSEEPFSLLTYADPDTRRGDVTANIGMLRQFGDVKVLSSPRIMAINNQTALLKVVDNLVYFTIEADTVATDGIATTTFTSTVHTVPVGFVMSVTPQINDTDTVILNIRPTISRVTSFVRDPNPSLAPFKIESSVPQIQVREMDSLLRINSGQTAVLGGLIQDSVDLNRSGTPVLSELPGIGDAFSYRDNRVSRSELVIFLRPRVIREASVGGELVDYQRYLPDRQRISAEPERLTERLPGGGS